MRVFIGGSWTMHAQKVLIEAIDCAELIGIDITEIVVGADIGVDQLARRFAQEWNIPVFTMTRVQQAGMPLSAPRAVDAAIWVFSGDSSYVKEKLCADLRAAGVLTVEWRV